MRAWILFLTCFAFVPDAVRAQGGVVFVADGAGDSVYTSDVISRIVRDDCLPLTVERVDWSHGRFRALADQTDYANHRCQGKLLAERILAHRAQCPEGAIYLVGHSAGGMVILAALENLPPGTVDRAFLMSPSVSSCYDLGPALAAVKCGLHNFYSKCDVVVLGVLMRVFGTADRQRTTTTAGRVGFDYYDATGKLQQRDWMPGDCADRNLGGHYGGVRYPFLRANVVSWMR